ncbi:MAG: helix-hairpin-helix domain-containing protein, partial [bacterium]|nr:helix-hairpin-helix domain-containing protein [bacterium]
MRNQEIAKIFHEISAFLEMENVQFKPRAYEKAAHSIEALEEDVADIHKKGGLKALEKIPGVGVSIAEKIEEYLKTGCVKEYEKLKKKTPVDVEGLAAIEGVGPKMIKTLYQKLKIKNIDDLEKAAQQGKIRRLEHFGEKTEQNILRGIEFLRKSGGRFILGFVLPEIRQIVEMLKKLPEVEKIEIAGSIRRRKETVGDADILIVSSKPNKVMDYFINLPQVMNVYAKGETKSAVKLKNGMDCDLRVVPPESFGAALQYFTGNKDHNIALRIMAEKKGWKLNEYGIFSAKGGSASGGKDKMIAGKTEEEIYRALELDWIEPEMRENWGEIELGRKHQLPNLIGYNDLQGDLQIQTDWTDGANSIEEMANEAKKLGLKYIAITDHTKSLAMTGGSDE